LELSKLETVNYLCYWYAIRECILGKHW